MNITLCPSENFDDRKDAQPPSMIIIHYTGTRTADEARLRFCDPNPQDSIGRISPHYMIDGSGHVFQFVDEKMRAWHAGRAAWGNVTDINSASIGIEIWNTGHEYDLEDFIPKQIDTVIALINDIRTRWRIPNKNVLGHSDVAPGRKCDPGEKFPWALLAEQGIGLMPKSDLTNECDEDFYAALRRYGYSFVDDEKVLLHEFRRHFLPHRLMAGPLGGIEKEALYSLLSQAEFDSYPKTTA